MTSKFVSLAPSPSPKLHACISPYLLNISTWIPNKHLKLDRSNTELLIPPTSLLSQCFSVSDFSIFAAGSGQNPWNHLYLFSKAPVIKYTKWAA